MSRKSERLFAALSDVSDKALDEAARAMEKRPRRWGRWAAGLAAALVLATGVGLASLVPWGGGGSGGSGSNSSTFMYYDGPVFPLTLREENSAITAARDITLDFAPWVPVWLSNEERLEDLVGLTEEQLQERLDQYNAWYPEGGEYRYSTNILVTDAYTLTNTSGEDQTVSVLYPFASTLQGVGSGYAPALTLDGQALETVLHAGNYTVGYMGAWGSTLFTEDSPGSVNLDRPDNWEDYRDVLSTGSYLERALSGYPDLSNIPITVYQFTDPWGPERSEDVPNPSLRAAFRLDYDRTTVLSTGFHAGRWDREAGTMTQGFSIPQPGTSAYERDRDRLYLLIVLGDDIQDLTLQGYVTGGVDDDPTVEAGATVVRYESDLESALRMYAEEQYGDTEWENGIDFEMYFGLMKDQLVHYGLLSQEPMEMYSTGWLPDLDFASVDRVFYLGAEVTVPAGGSVTLTAELSKDGSHDFTCANTENRNVYGYDMVTRLGSCLTFTRQSAQLEDRGQIKIVRENFGFDLSKNVRTVELAPAQEHYYLEVKRVKDP